MSARELLYPDEYCECCNFFTAQRGTQPDEKILLFGTSETNGAKSKAQNENFVLFSSL